MDLSCSFQCALAALHLLGPIVAFLVRACAGSVVERPLQWLFLFSLASVAVATIAGAQLHWPLWTLSGAIMAVMIVVVVADFHQSQPELHA